MKNNYMEISKIYNFVDEIKTEKLIMSNIKYYKNVSIKNIDMIYNKFEEYFKYESQFRQKYKKRKNIEGYKIKLLVSEVLILKENRKKLREYIEKTIELFTSYSKADRLKYVCSYYRTSGGSFYINIFFIDRVIYEKPQVETVKKNVG